MQTQILPSTCMVAASALALQHHQTLHAVGMDQLNKPLQSWYSGGCASTKSVTHCWLYIFPGWWLLCHIPRINSGPCTLGSCLNARRCQPRGSTIRQTRRDATGRDGSPAVSPPPTPGRAAATRLLAGVFLRGRGNEVSCLD